MIKEFRGDYRFLSNFCPCKIEYEGKTYLSVEHAYQAAKTINDVERAYFSGHNLTPSKAKELGRIITLRDGWDSIKLKVMEDLVRYKFNHNETLKKALLETKDEELQEGNWWGDLYWGVDLKTGIGENHLGKILMRIRAELINS